MYIEGGADVRYIQEMLGHSNLKSTQIYTRVSIQKLQEIHAATHPSAKRGHYEESDGSDKPKGNADFSHSIATAITPMLKAVVRGGRATIEDVGDYPDGTELEIAIVGNDPMSEMAQSEVY